MACPPASNVPSASFTTECLAISASTKDKRAILLDDKFFVEMFIVIRKEETDDATLAGTAFARCPGKRTG